MAVPRVTLTVAGSVDARRIDEEVRRRDEVEVADVRLPVFGELLVVIEEPRDRLAYQGEQEDQQECEGQVVVTQVSTHHRPARGRP